MADQINKEEFFKELHSLEVKKVFKKVLSLVKKYCDDVYEIYDKHNMEYINRADQLLFGYYDTNHGSITIDDIYDDHIIVSCQWKHNEYIKYMIIWDDLLEFNPIAFEYELCKEIHSKLHKKTVDAQNQLHLLQKELYKYGKIYKKLDKIIQEP